MSPTRACVPFLLLAVLPAESGIVSPGFYVDEEGTTLATQPFGSASSTTACPLRAQQVVGGLRGTARVFRSLAFRRDGAIGANPLFGTRSVDFELHLEAVSYFG